MAQQEKINEVHEEEQELREEFNASGDDGIKSSMQTLSLCICSLMLMVTAL